MLLLDILLGFLASSSFIFGFILYKAAKEEVDNFAKRFQNKKLAFILPKIALPIAGIFGLLLAVSTKLTYIKTAAILIFAAGLIFGTLALRAKEIKTLLKHMIEVVISFLVFYFVVLVFLNLG